MKLCHGMRKRARSVLHQKVGALNGEGAAGQRVIAPPTCLYIAWSMHLHVKDRAHCINNARDANSDEA